MEKLKFNSSDLLNILEGREYNSVKNISKLKKGDIFIKVGGKKVYVYDGRSGGKFQYHEYNDINNCLSTANDIMVDESIPFSESENIIGGKADNKSNVEIAKSKKISIDDVEDEIEKGVKVQKEHTDKKEVAREIAKDHIIEFKGYYDALDYMEKILEFDENRKVAKELSEDDKDEIKKILSNNGGNYKKTFLKILKKVEVESEVVENYLLSLISSSIVEGNTFRVDDNILNPTVWTTSDEVRDIITKYLKENPTVLLKDFVKKYQGYVNSMPKVSIEKYNIALNSIDDKYWNVGRGNKI